MGLIQTIIRWKQDALLGYIYGPISIFIGILICILSIIIWVPQGLVLGFSFIAGGLYILYDTRRMDKTGEVSVTYEGEYGGGP